MGPKKKKGGKKGGKKSGSKAGGKQAAEKFDDALLNEVTKEFFYIQIRDLEKKVSRYQKKCDALELRNNEVEKKYDCQSKDKKEIVTFLKNQLDSKSEEIISLQERIVTLQEQNEEEKSQAEHELLKVRRDMQEDKDQLNSENMILSGKMAALEEFRLQQDDLLKKFSDMEEFLRSQEMKHKEQIYWLERKSVVDEDRLKKEMIVRVNTVAAEFRKVSNKQIADTAKRAIMENVQISSQLSKMSDETMDIIKENDKLKLREKTQRQNLNVVEQTEQDLIKKNTSHQKVIRMLTEKARQQNKALKEFGELKTQYEQLKIQLAGVNDKLEEQRIKSASLSSENKKLFENGNMLRRNVEMLTDAKAYLVGVLSDANNIIKETLSENKDEGIVDNSKLFCKILDLLNVAAKMGVGADPLDFASKRISRRNLKCFNQSVRLPQLLAPITKPIAHYKLGDLGLVPSVRDPELLKTVTRTDNNHCNTSI